MTISEFLLEATKQYAQSLKKQLDIPLSKAQETTARAHSFADWHELVTIADRHTGDARLRAAAISARSGPGLLVPITAQVLQGVAPRLAVLAGLEVATATQVDAQARGLSGASWIKPSHHFALDQQLALPDHSPVSSGKLSVNLFDPSARLVFVSGCVGWGKSGFGVGVAGAHYAAGGTVLYLDPLASFCADPAARNVSDHDKPGQLLNTILNRPDAVLADARSVTSRAALGRFTVVSSPWAERGFDEYLRILEAASTWLAPFSVVVVDEGHLPHSLKGSPEGLSRLAAAIDQLIEAEISVVLLSLHPILDELPIDRAVKEGLTVIIGRMQAIPAPSVPAPARKRTRGKRDFSIDDLMKLPPPRQPTPDESIASMSGELKKVPGQYSSWICSVIAQDGEPVTFIGQQPWAGIEAPFMALSTAGGSAAIA